MVAVWQAEQSFKHPVCGTFDWEWEENPQAWSAGIHWCLGCREIELKRAQVAREHPHGDGVEGWTIRLYREPQEDSDGE